MDAKPQSTGAISAPEAMTQALAAWSGTTNLYHSRSRVFADLAACQIENGQEFLLDSLEDFDLVSQATKPEALLHAELAILRRRARRAGTAAEHFLEQVDAPPDAMTQAAQKSQPGEWSTGRSA